MKSDDDTNADSPSTAEELEKAGPIVGIGASAGGIDALHRFFGATSADSNLAYVVVQHLDPQHESNLAEVLTRSTSLPVSVVENDMRIEPGHVYVIPPNVTMTLSDRRLRLTAATGPRSRRSTVDAFFQSLGSVEAENLACVILSGTGSDGTLGLRAVKERGGLTLAQADAEYDGMMRSALTAGLIDMVLPADQMPAKLTEYFGHVASCMEEQPADQEVPSRETVIQVCNLLKARTGHDFKGYKDKTIVRRIQRRMHVLQITDENQFLEQLRADPRQVDRLFQELLIGVTEFFRDPDAFLALEHEVITKLFERRSEDGGVRVWVPGCSTGEEAYSIAMLIHERMPRNGGNHEVQIFASDIDEAALDIARTGRYPATIAKGISKPRLERYFVREDGTYRVTGELRDMCLFCVHNILRDAPFSRLDLISCRNLLIYLNADLQAQIIPLFHYALRENGYLFLGPSENVTRHQRLFATVDKSARIFRRRPPAGRFPPKFPLATPTSGRRKLLESPARAGAIRDLRLQEESEIIARYIPAYVVINAEGDVLKSSGGTGKLLELPAGTPDINIFNMARHGLSLDIRVAVREAESTGRAAARERVTLSDHDGSHIVDIIVQPMNAGSGADTLYMVIFRDLGAAESHAEGETDGEGERDASLRGIEAELRATKERLQTTTEELESSNEELKSSNEELSSMNEELQSANEELETSREELQSINEELQTVNAELSARVDELARANSDMSNLLESTQIATVFLDRSLCIKSFTPAARDLFHLVESDAGRPISHVRARFKLESMQEDAERVLRTLSTLERPVESMEGNARYSMRILPYRTVDNVINGVVITFTDVTQITAAQDQINKLTLDLRSGMEDFESLLGMLPVGIFISSEDEAAVARANRYGAELLGYADASSGMQRRVPLPVLMDENGVLPPEAHPLVRALKTGDPGPVFEGRMVRTDGSTIEVIMTSISLFNEEGRPRGGIAAVVDNSERKEAEAHREVLLHELQHRVKNVLATVSALVSRMLKTSTSVGSFAERLQSRLSAMGRIHDLLSLGNWRGADLRTIVIAALTPYSGLERNASVIEGETVVLAARQASALGMIFHELATNAAKYGALSSPGGTVHVKWTKKEAGDNASEVIVEWLETNGPCPIVPTQEGFGTSFIRKSVSFELDGSIDLRFEPTGLQCTLRFPLQTRPSGVAYIGGFPNDTP